MWEDTMTGIGTAQALAVEPRVDVTTIAAIVQDLVKGGLAQLRDKSWLRNHPLATRLAAHEYAALEALGARLNREGPDVVANIHSIWW
jgi:hypothetical protein